MIRNHTAPRLLATTLLIALSFAVAAFAGCLGVGTDSDDHAPTAVLTADTDERWTGEQFAFNASTSSDPNGDITRWHFDFGDGTDFETASQEKAENTTHAYKQGGIFNATLTITDDGTNQTGKETATDVVVVTVHDDVRVTPRANYAVPEGAGDASNSTVLFRVNEGAVAYEANITVTSLIPAGTSTVTLRVLTPDGALVEMNEVSVDAGKQVTEILAGTFDGHGAFTLEIGVTSGGVSTEGMMRIYYGEDPIERADA